MKNNSTKSVVIKPLNYLLIRVGLIVGLLGVLVAMKSEIEDASRSVMPLFFIAGIMVAFVLFWIIMSFFEDNSEPEIKLKEDVKETI